MRRTTPILASLLVAGVLGAPACPSVATDPSPASGPPERLLVAVPDPGADVPEDLAGRLRLADPAATVLVVRAGEAPGDAGSFPVAVDGGGLRIGSVAVALPDASTAESHVTIVEVLGDAAGVLAHRIGDLVVSPDEIRLPAWRLPPAGIDAVALDGTWWELTPSAATALAIPDPDDGASARLGALRERAARKGVSDLRRIVDAALGDVTGDGAPELVLSFRRPFRRTLLNAPLPRDLFTDAQGLSAHVGLYRPGDLAPVWVAGTLLRPVRALAACDGAVAVATSSLDDPRVRATNVWPWQGFGFLQLPELPGPGRPACIDIDRDGRLDAAIVERS
jgi:hypothetical protein